MKKENCLKTSDIESTGSRSVLYQQLFDSMQEGFALHEILCDEAGEPFDYRFIDINPAFEQLTGIKREVLVGKTVKEVMPTTETYWIQRYGKVALTGESLRFEAFAEAIGRYYNVYAYSPGPHLFATLFSDVTDRVQAEEALKKSNEALEAKVRERTRELDAANQELTAQNEEVRAMNEELTAQNEEINAMNEEISTLNAELVSLNDSLEQRVDARTRELQRSLDIQHVLRDIAEAALMSSSLPELYETVHRLIDRVLPGKQFHINLLDATSREIIVPYKSEEVDFIPQRRPIDKGITEYIIRSGKAMYLKPVDLERLIESGEYSLSPVRVGQIQHYLGVPLFDSHGAALGTMGLIMMGNEREFAETDIELLAIIAAQVAMAMERKRAEEAVFEQETRQAKEIEKDAQAATRIQHAMLSKSLSTSCLLVDAISKPAGYVGGDLYYMDWRYDSRLLRGFLIDAAGHGLGTALHTAALHVLLREVNEMDLPLSEAMRWLNQRAYEYFAKEEIDGAIAFELDMDVRQLRWVCGGNPLLWVSTSEHSGCIPCEEWCLGVKEDSRFDLHTMPVEIGDSFIFMTDGMRGVFEEGAEALMGGHKKQVSYLKEIADEESQRDDATAICIRINAFPRSTVHQDGWPKLLRLNGYGDYQRLKGEIAKILASVTGLSHSLQEVAVNEAVANALECRDGKSRHQQAKLKFNHFGNRLVARVKTTRIGFAGNALLRRLRANPEEMFAFGEDASMGRGIPMMLSMTDTMIYNSEGTELLLAWRLSKKKSAQAEAIQ